MGGTPVRSPLLTVTVTGLSRNAKKSQRLMKQTNQLKPGFHSNAIASLRALRKITKTARNASACVGKQPIMVATASTEHSYWLVLA